MRRRKLLKGLGGATAGALLAGCGGLDFSESSPDIPHPKVQWSEEEVEELRYAVDVEVTIDTAERLLLRNRSGEEVQLVQEITEDGTYDVAGPDTELGAIHSGYFTIDLPDEADGEIQGFDIRVGRHFVGTGNHTDTPDQSVYE